MKQFLNSNSTLVFILLTGILLVIAFISYKKIRQFNRSVDAVMHTNEVKTNVFEVDPIQLIRKEHWRWEQKCFLHPPPILML